MNKAQRKELTKVISALELLKSTIEEIKDQEQEKADNTPENLQGGERYEKLTEGIDALENSGTDLENVINDLEGLK